MSDLAQVPSEVRVPGARAGVSPAHDVVRRAAAATRRRLFLAGLLDGLAAVAVALGALLLGARVLLGLAPAPHPAFAAALIPAVVHALRHARRRAPTAADLALHLDRRLGLEGLLVSGLERDPGGFAPALAGRLAALPAALPRLRGRRLVLRLLAAAAFLAAVLALPVPERPASAGERAAAGAAVEGLREELERLVREGAVSEDTEAELERRLDELERALASDRPPTWADIDGVEARLAQERGLARAANERLRAALDAATAPSPANPGELQQTRAVEAPSTSETPEARPPGAVDGASTTTGARVGADPGAPGPRPSDPRAREMLARALEQAAASGLLRRLPEDLVAELAKAGRAGATGEIDPSKLPLSEEELRALAERLRAALERPPHPSTEACRSGQCESCAGGAMAGGGEGSKPGGGRTGQGAGERSPAGLTPGGAEGMPVPGEGFAAGGTSRGPGTGPVGEGAAPGGDPRAADPSRPLVLPPGTPEGEGRLIEAARAEPEVDPTRAAGPGGAGVASRDAVTTGARRLPPRLRDVVRRFFAEEGEAPK